MVDHLKIDKPIDMIDDTLTGSSYLITPAHTMSIGGAYVDVVSKIGCIEN